MPSQLDVILLDCNAAIDELNQLVKHHKLLGERFGPKHSKPFVVVLRPVEVVPGRDEEVIVTDPSIAVDAANTIGAGMALQIVSAFEKLVQVATRGLNHCHARVASATQPDPSG